MTGCTPQGLFRAKETVTRRVFCKDERLGIISMMNCSINPAGPRAASAALCLDGSHDHSREILA